MWASQTGLAESLASLAAASAITPDIETIRLTHVTIEVAVEGMWQSITYMYEKGEP